MFPLRPPCAWYRVLALAAACLGHAADAQTLPSGFTATRLFPTATLPGPTALAFTPDGRMLITLQGGQLRVAEAGAVLPTPALTIDATRLCSNSERGLLGVAVDPQFAANHYVYLYYTYKKFGVCPTGAPTNASNPVNRVSRFVLPATNVIDPASETVLFDNMISPNGNHNGGDLHFGKDGYLYVSVGDGGADYLGDSGAGGANDASRDRNVPLGKILRIDRNGNVPPTNPFTGAGTARCNSTGSAAAGSICQETYAWGLRNPFRFAMDPNAAGVRFFINDVGQDAREEIDDAQAGADYGWNCREGTRVNNSSGPCNPTPAGMVDPIFEYAHNAQIPGTSSPTNCAAITGGAFVPQGLWPGYDGAYLAADYICGVIFRLAKPAASWVASDFALNLGANSATSLTFAPYGNAQGLHFTSYAAGGSIWVISYEAAGNNAPTASATAAPLAGALPLNVMFDASASSDPDPGDTLTYFWDFGDGATAITASASIAHAYAQAGTYSANVRVRDSHFAFSPAVSFTVSAGNAPPLPQIASPTPTTQFAVGQPIVLTGSASDPEDGVLPGSALSWRVLLHDGASVQPIFGPQAGNNVQFMPPAPSSLAAAGIDYLEIELTATDSQNAHGIVTQTLHPHVVALTFNTAPAGLHVTVGGQSVAHGTTLSAWEAWAIPVSAPPQASGPTNYFFSAWSDGGTSTHTIATPASNNSYTASFVTTAPPSADADANGAYDALTDGLLLIRRMFGLSGPSLTANAIGAGALRASPDGIASFIDANNSSFDVDGNGATDALTDGLLIVRYLFGVRGTSLIQNAIGSGASRTTAAQIETYLQGLFP